MIPALDEAAVALEDWSLLGATLSPLGRGLINHTFLVEPTEMQRTRLGLAAQDRFVLQRLNPIFDARIHENIAAVIRRLEARGLRTLTLVTTRDGALWSERGGAYRMYRHIDGESYDVVESLDQAHSAGRSVGQFHAALDVLEHDFVALREGVHDTSRHLVVLRGALSRHATHALEPAVRELASRLEAQLVELPRLPSLAARPGHGDLKLGNILFARGERDRALCLVDLDTVGPIHLGHELGDMWRSWCNRATEDETEARLDLDVLDASWSGYLEGCGRALSDEERDAALLGLEWIALELAARFAADALIEGYFGWDPARFPTRGAHNLERARGQLSLLEAATRTRSERRRILSRA